jgi:hypothetical protein
VRRGEKKGREENGRQNENDSKNGKECCEKRD